MNPSFKTFLGATAEDRRDAFLGAGRRLGPPEQNIEKDFWVSWTLDALFNGAESGGGPRLLFKGGTSLSKAFGLISRFSEDIDITIFRDDLGEAADVTDLEALTGKQRRKRLDAIAERYPPRVAVDLDAVADMLAAVVDGGIILSKVVRDKNALPQQVMLYREFVRCIFLGN